MGSSFTEKQRWVAVAEAIVASARGAREKAEADAVSLGDTYSSRIHLTCVWKVERHTLINASLPLSVPLHVSLCLISQILNFLFFHV